MNTLGEQHSESVSAADSAFEVAETRRGGLSEAQSAELEASLQERMDARRRRLGRNRVIWWVVLLALPVSGAVFFATSEEAREFAGKVAQDVRMATSADKMKESFDEALAEVEVRNDQINNSTRALGIDPSQAATAKELARFEASIRNASGGERTAIDRNRELQERYGHVR